MGHLCVSLWPPEMGQEKASSEGAKSGPHTRAKEEVLFCWAGLCGRANVVARPDRSNKKRGPQNRDNLGCVGGLAAMLRLARVQRRETKEEIKIK